MKFKDFFYLLEQPEPPVPDDDEDIDPLQLQPIPDEDEDEEGGNEEPIEPEPEQEPRQPKPKKMSVTKMVKMKWIEDNPGLTEAEATEGIEFFREIKDNLRPYHPYGFRDQGGRHWVNIPEITSIVLRFPEMEPILSKVDLMKDIKNYPWEVISYYMDLLQETEQENEEVNLVPGLEKRTTEEKLEEAKQVWYDNPANIIDENNFKVRKINSKQQAIIYGSIQRILRKKRDELGQKRGNLYWCVTVPPNTSGRSNLWTNYRPGGPYEQGFYFVWDLERDETDPFYFCSVNPYPERQGGFSVVDLYNETVTMQWSDVERNIPKLRGKENLFPYYGTTKEEKTAITLDAISTQKGHKNYLGTLENRYKMQYVDSGRHINNVELFSTLPPEARNLYVAKTTKANNDLHNRFLCDDPIKPFGIIDFLRLEKKPKDLYKFLDEAILKYQLGIPEGVMAIKKLIIGRNWERGISDDEQGKTLIRPKTSLRNRDRKSPYGIINTLTGDIEKSPEYIPQIPSAYFQPYLNENGEVKRDKHFIFQRFLYRKGDGNYEQNEGFCMFYPKEAVAAPREGDVSNLYLKGKYFDLSDGEKYIRSKVATGELVRM